jgi:hypothetical protein
MLARYDREYEKSQRHEGRFQDMTEDGGDSNTDGMRVKMRDRRLSIYPIHHSFNCAFDRC